MDVFCHGARQMLFVLKVRETPPEGWLEGVRRGPGYVKGVWDRLNGRGRANDRSTLPAGLPLPVSTKVRRLQTCYSSPPP